MDTIETCFGKDSVKEIMTALEEDGSEWATKRLDAMKAASPLSLAVRPLSSDTSLLYSFSLVRVDLRSFIATEVIWLYCSSSNACTDYSSGHSHRREFREPW